VVLIDFDHAMFVDREPWHAEDQCTPGFTPPEITPQCHYDLFPTCHSIDAWGVGIMLLQVVHTPHTPVYREYI
jgi:hypothetical protein